MNARLEISRQNHVLIILSLLLLISFGLRLSILDRDSLWFDEAFSYFIATHLPWQDILTNKIQSAHPPLYYLFLHYWLHLFPTSDGMGRLMSLFWGVAFAPTLYLLARQLLPTRRLALFAGVMAIVAPAVAIYSAELRMYTQTLLFVTLGALAYVYAFREERHRFWLLFIGAFTAALYTHLFTSFSLAAVGLHGWIMRRQRPDSFRMLALMIGLIALLFLPWIIVILIDANPTSGSLRPLTGDSSLLTFDYIRPWRMLTFILFGSSDFFGLRYMTPYQVVAFILVFVALLVFPLEMRKARRRQELDSWLLLPVIMLLVIVGVPSLIYYIRPFFLPDRAVIMALPFALILLAWGLTRRNSPLPLIGYGSILLMVFGSWLYFSAAQTKDPYDDAAALIAQQYRSGDVVAHTFDFSYLPLLRYTQGKGIEPHVRLTGDSLRPLIVYETVAGHIWDRDQVEQSGDRLWLVIASLGNREWERYNAAYFLERYRLVDYFPFGGVGVYLFDLKTGR